MIRLWTRAADKSGTDTEHPTAEGVVAELARAMPIVAIVETSGHADFFDVRDALQAETARKQKGAMLTSTLRPSFETYVEQGIAATADGWRIILRRCRISGTPSAAQ